MGGLRMVDVLARLLLSLTLFGHVTSAQNVTMPPLFRRSFDGELLAHPMYIPPEEVTLDSDFHEAAPAYDTTTRLPDVMVVSEYFLKVKPYYPAPGIEYEKEKNMTFEGFVSMPATIKKPTSVLTLNALNIVAQKVEVTNFIQKQLKVKETKYDKEKQQFAIILDKQLEPGAVILISITYTGIINHFSQAGFFYTYYIDEKHQTNWMVATKLEAFHARKVFPCMDEPIYKAVFHIELTYPTAHVALSNMLEQKSTELGKGWSHIAFPPTQAMSTYLMVFTIGPYVMHSVWNKDGTLVRSVGWTGQEPYLEFAAETAGECLYQMGKISKIKFAMEKCDHLGLPEFPSGAMENYGLVIYKYQSIAINFKDALTVRSDLEPALEFDASPNTHPLIAPDGPYFDRITYKKGASLIRMLNDVLGEEVLWDGLSSYLSRYANGNADHKDLWKCLTDRPVLVGGFLYELLRMILQNQGLFGVHYDDDSFEALLKKIKTDDVPIGVKVMLIGDEVAFIGRAKKAGEAYSYNRLLHILNTVFHTPNIQNDPRYTLIDIALPQLEFFANVLRDSIDSPLIDALYKSALEVAYHPKLWEISKSWDINAFAFAYLPVAVRYNIGDSVKKALKLFDEIMADCKAAQSSNGTSWCTKVPTDLHRAIYCAAAKYDNKIGSHFASLMYYFNREVQTNPYFYQEYRSLLYGLTCAEGSQQLRTLIRGFLSSPLQPSLLFGWLKSNPKASDALLQQIRFLALHEQLRGRLEPEQEKLFVKYEQRIRDNMEWSAEFTPSIMKWMYDNLVVVEKVPWTKRLPGDLIVSRYDVEITPYIPGSASYKHSKNLTFDGKITITFGMESESNEIVLDAHRLVIDTDTIKLVDDEKKDIWINPQLITKDYDNGMITMIAEKVLVPRKVYKLTIEYNGFIFDGPHRGAVVSNHNYYEFNGKKGWIFSTDFEAGPGARTLMICADEPAYKAVVKMTVRHPADLTALSNMMDSGTDIKENGWAVTTYEESPPMSTYLIAISVGHFSALTTVSKTGVLARAYSWTGMEKYLDYTLKVMAGSIDYMSKYFDHPFPLKKLDLVALPQHSSAGAMENWGLILGHYEFLMVDMDYVNIAKLSRVGNGVAHETVHMWFGDLITMDWWSDVFIKEGFAKYWSANAHAYAIPEQTAYVLNYTRFQVYMDALDFDCSPDHCKPMLSDTPPILGKIPYFKGSALLNLLSNVMSPETLQKGLRRYIKKNINGVSNAEDLWASLTEVCAEDGVKDWEGKNLNVSVLMKEWSYETSFPILKASATKRGIVTYELEACLGNVSDWKIPVFRGDGKSEKLLWFRGKNGNSPDWSPYLPLYAIDNVRTSSFLRMQYDDLCWADLLKNLKTAAKDHETQGQLLSDALFFARKGVYKWPKFLDLVHAINWEASLTQWRVAFSFMDTFYHNFRYHFEFKVVKMFLMALTKKVYRQIGLLDQTKWEMQALGAQLQDHLCRIGHASCLQQVNAEFQNFAAQCARSRHGTAKCVGVAPDYRQSMYCYGLRQNPKSIEVVESMWKYFAEKAIYFNRDGEKLLHAMSCTNDTSKLNGYIDSAIRGELPETIIQYIGDNEVTGQLLFDHFNKNLKKVIESPKLSVKVLWGNVNFDNYVDAMTRDWSTDEHLEKLMHFKYNPLFKALNEEQKKTWDKAIQKVVTTKKWLAENAASIVDWIDAHYF
ncbi:peptidase family M1 [Ancylostoma caninum]|uniref:Peptidase family M1 n=1 Tax=Ancylostoma caninum TaxID=29170 RepID=A0A368FN65_ANCCA|nr:peptidase family M1 [Ancylostoma caninum]